MVLGNTGAADLTANLTYATANGRPWIGVSPATMTVPAGASANITVTLDAGVLLGGAHGGEIRIAHNDPAVSSPFTVPVTFTVTGTKALVAVPASLTLLPQGSDRNFAFTQRIVNDTLSEVKVVKGADMDGDKDLLLQTGSKNGSENSGYAYWYENDGRQNYGDVDLACATYLHGNRIPRPAIHIAESAFATNSAHTQLVNHGAAPTTVTALTSSSDRFRITNKLPLVVPPWDSVAVNIAYVAGAGPSTARLASAVPGPKTMTLSVDGMNEATFVFSDTSGWQSWRQSLGLPDPPAGVRRYGASGIPLRGHRRERCLARQCDPEVSQGLAAGPTGRAAGRRMTTRPSRPKIAMPPALPSRLNRTPAADMPSPARA